MIMRYNQQIQALLSDPQRFNENLHDFSPWGFWIFVKANEFIKMKRMK